MESSIVRSSLFNQRLVSSCPCMCSAVRRRGTGVEGSFKRSRVSSISWQAAALKEERGVVRLEESGAQGGDFRRQKKWLHAFLKRVEILSASSLEEDSSGDASAVGRWMLAAVGVLGMHVILRGGVAWAGSGAETVATDQIAGFFDDGSDFSSGFASAFLLIFFSELGDKTFFIAALLAARKSGAPVFVGTFGALAAMSVISVALGRGFHYADEVLPFGFGQIQVPLDDVAAVVLLTYFGVTTLMTAASMDNSGLAEEQQEAELAIAGVDEAGAGSGGLRAAAGTVLGTFTLVFVAEWGDKSFFSTIALAAASDPLGVVSGAIAGHGVATLLAVLGGSFLSNYVSERVIAYVGGALFLVFAGLTLVEVSLRL